MTRAKVIGWLATVATVAITFLLFGYDTEPVPSLSTFLFWIGLLAAVEVLPVSLGYGTEVTMAFPVYLALAIVFHEQIWVAMLIASLGALDPRELRREIPLWKGLWNRAQTAISVAAAAGVLALYDADLFTFPTGSSILVVAAFTRLAVNFGLVVWMVHLEHGQRYGEVVRALLPQPPEGFIVSYLLLAALGVVTAVAYIEIGAAAVAAILIPLFFARLSLLGARTQRELSERVRKQQELLLLTTQRVFEERERERKRIAEEIHDSSLQMMAAAAYGCGNAQEFIQSGEVNEAKNAVGVVHEAVDGAITALRESLTDLRRSSLEEGGLMESVGSFVAQVATLWGTEIRINGRVSSDPPLPVSLVAFQILQEGLINALKHSESDAITVNIGDGEGQIHIVVEDSGKGFVPQDEAGGEHVGMELMRERARQVGGDVEIDSTPGQGTRLRARLPAGVST